MNFLLIKKPFYSLKVEQKTETKIATSVEIFPRLEELQSFNHLDGRGDTIGLWTITVTTNDKPNLTLFLTTREATPQAMV